MKRIAIIAAAIAMFASTAAIALADEATESPDGEPENTEERVLNDTQMWKVYILAAYWLSTDEGSDESSDDEEAIPEPSDSEEAVPEPTIEEEIEALRTGEIIVGWGAMFKLMELARAYDISLSEAAEIRDAEDGWAFGRRFKEIREDDPEFSLPEGLPKNFGHLQKQAKAAAETRGKKPKKP